jgi:hypothetical protein
MSEWIAITTDSNQADHAASFPDEMQLAFADEVMPFPRSCSTNWSTMPFSAWRRFTRPLQLRSMTSITVVIIIVAFGISPITTIG